jgi:DNA-binding XRE family transcriptional regulator
MPRHLAIPPEALGRFVLGEITIRQLGRLCGADQDRVSRALRALGVDTSPGAHKRRRIARRTEAAAQLPAGSAYETAAYIYRQGAALRNVAAALGCEKKAAGAFIRRLDETVRPEWCREVFRHPDGRHMDVTPFARRLRALRLSRGWSQARTGEECGLSPQCIGRLERAEGGPKWETLDKLARGLGLSREDLGVTWQPLP